MDGRDPRSADASLAQLDRVLIAFVEVLWIFGRAFHTASILLPWMLIKVRLPVA